MKYLFNEWDRVKEKLENKYLFIFLDFDGTLAPIAQTPDKAILSKEAKELLKRLLGKVNLKIAFISGRAVEDIKNKVGLEGIIYSGNHGLEIEGPKLKFKPAVPREYRLILERIKHDLQKKASNIRGVLLEDKGLSLSLHYRRVAKKQIPLIKEIFHETVILYLVRNKIKINSGKMVLEVRPPLEWNKGKVVLWLLARQLFAAGEKSILPIYIGDDVTDEDAFKALKKKGLTIFVGGNKVSSARYYLKNTNEVVVFLKKILEV